MEPDKLQRVVLENLSEGVYFVDADRTILYWNSGAQQISGYSSVEVIGTHCWDNILMHVDSEGRSLCRTRLCPLVRAIESSKKVETEAFLRHKDGHRVPVLIKSAPTFDDDGQVNGAVETFVDNSSSQELRDQVQSLRNDAMLDPLTGLSNRRFLENVMETRFGELDRYGWPFAVVFFDVDDFKRINDRYGHDAGDEVLKMISRTLFSNSRSFDVPGRWGGEEFLVVCRNVTMGDLFRITERYRLLVDTSRVQVESDIINVTISLGATLARPGETMTSLVSRADKLMYKSKQEGKNQGTVEE